MTYAAAVDTNVLVRIITNDQVVVVGELVQEILKAPESSLFIDTAVVAEVVYVLSSTQLYGYSRQDVARSIIDVCEIKQFTLDRKLIEQALSTFSNTKLDFVDCLVLAHQQLGRAQAVLTRDKKLLRTAKN